jgi:hypothetical protein
VDDSRAEGLSRRISLAIAWVPVGGALVLGLFATAYRPAFCWLMSEDHPLEWLQFAVCALTVVVTGVTVIALVRQGRPGVAAVFLVFCAGALVLSGEEISWGQRIFTYDAAPLSGINSGTELNFDDALSGQLAESTFKLVELSLALGGTLLAIVARGRAPRSTVEVARLLAPPLIWVPAFALSFAFLLFRFTVDSGLNNTAVLFTEWAELCLYAGLLGLAISAYRRVTARSLGWILAGAVGVGLISALLALVTMVRDIFPGPA